MNRKHPKKVKSLQSEFVKSVACGAHCTAAIAEPREKDGIISSSRLWIWGQNQVNITFKSYRVVLISFVPTVMVYGKSLPLSFIRGQIVHACFREHSLPARYVVSVSL